MCNKRIIMTQPKLPEDLEKEFDNLKFTLKEEDSFKGFIPDHVYKQWFAQKLSTAKAEGAREALKAFEKAEAHGILKYPNQYGETVKVLRHNQVIEEMKNIFIKALTPPESTT